MQRRLFVRFVIVRQFYNKKRIGYIPDFRNLQLYAIQPGLPSFPGIKALVTTNFINDTKQ